MRLGSGRQLVVCVLAAYAIAAMCMASGAFATNGTKTDRGRVQGVETPTLTKYLGIPYAAPPVGDLRWRPPQPPARWKGVLDASQFGNHCPQPASPFGRPSTTEDCLYLNVFTPNGHKGPRSDRGKNGQGNGKGHEKHLPVMVWIHGGALAVGESDDYDPTKLVEKGTVVVTLNYRLGTLGFLANPALSAESGYQGSGDYGLMDQQAALRWVKRNIARFGGDPGNVTIFGESAGGLSVHAHLVSPLSAGLFERGIAQSGAYALDIPSLASAEGQGTTFAQSYGCTDLATETACLRAISVPNILATQPTTTGSVLPNVDGRVLPQSIKAALDSGQFNRVPVVEGTTHDEFSLFAATNIEFVFGVLPASFYPTVVGIFLNTVGLHASPAAVLAEYPIANYQQSVGRGLTAIGTDALFACPGRRAAQSLSKFVPTFAYEFNDPNAPQLFVGPASFPYLAYHGSEVQYLFDIPNQTGAAALNTDQQTLADTMKRYWTQFAGSGTPNTGATPFWPGYSVTGDTYQSLTPPTPVPTTGFAADHNCAFWDAQSLPG
jgi:para-nitrobenzyl esterase